MVRRSTLVLVAILIGILGLSGCSSSSQSLLDRVRDDGVLVVGTEGTYSPFSYQGGDGQLTGYDIDVINAVGDELGVRVDFVQTPFDSIFAGLQSQRFDLIANQVSITPARQSAYDLSKPYTVSEGQILTAANNTTITSTADLAGKTTAQSSTSNWAEVAADAGANVEAVEGFVQAVALVKDGRVQESNYHDYRVLRMNQMPQIEVHIVPSTDKPGGIGEVGVPPVAAALGNALFALTGQRQRQLPLRVTA